MNKPIQVEQTPVDALIPFARNARTHSDEQVKQIAASIREFGFNNPILIRDDLTVIAGHGRLAAAKVLGLKEVPTISLSHLTPLQVRAYVLADNKLALNAGWDDEMLTVELKDLELEGFDVSLTGFDEVEVSSLLADNTEEGLTDDDDVPAEVVNPVTRPGDIWVLGRHRVMCGDSLSSESVSKLLNGNLADLWITDPPYNVSYVGGTEDALTIKNDSMGDTEFRDFLRGAYTAANANMREGAAFYIWFADVETHNFTGALADVGFKMAQMLIWKKSSFVMGRKDYHFKHEPCLYGWKEGAAHFWGGDRKQTTIMEFDKPNRNGEHPTMKPVELFAYQISNSSQEGEAVLDSFGGSGTTLIACEKLNRKAYLMELDTKYCDVIVKRWQEFTGKKAVLESSGKTYDELKPL